MENKELPEYKVATNYRPGDHYYRSWIGPAQFFDINGAAQFCLLTSCLGMREQHNMLDIGCGALRAGRFFMTYLTPGNYHGLEPEEWVVQEGINKELGQEFVEKRRPVFKHNSEFDLETFGKKFNYIIAQSIFSHAAPHQIKKCLAQAKLVLSDNGIFVFNYGKGRRDYEKEEWVYPGCVAYREETIAKWVSDAGLHHKMGVFPLMAKKEWVCCSLSKTRLKDVPEEV